MLDRKHVGRYVFLFILLLLVFFIMKSFYANYRMKKELIEQGIYEVYSTYVFARHDMVAYYMICEPPDNKEDLDKMVNTFPEKEEVVSKLRKRGEEWNSRLEEQYDENYLFTGVRIEFMKPTKQFPIGEFPKDIESSDYSVATNRLVTIYITFDGADVRYDCYYNDRLLQ